MIDPLERPSSLVERVVHKLQTEIQSGVYPANMRLPAEQTLADNFKVSRPVIREAIARLKVDQILVTRKGSGAYVSDNPVGNAYRLADSSQAGGGRDINFQHVFELRYWAECAAAELAALRRTPNDLLAMRCALDDMDHSANDFAAAGVADLAFHRAIAIATCNPYFSGFVDFLAHQLLETRRLAWENSAQRAVGPSPAQQEHRLILAAIVAADPNAAREAARAHLLAAAKRLGLTLSFNYSVSTIYPLADAAHGTR
ncbi:transcriptional regulator, GntR family [Rhodoferax ferrireducens T118]|uniref:Transcriptional regulator, GntR family n=1 Tax=Albidiferax ferrireducens (strain ATCC BAA-621 / DSM 15236 / T118) TaxID=338969 RepID=Q21XY2_ALBFT|nr:transcriptional regulator, GntR family [Rhodoferax ferrireducens T118]